MADLENGRCEDLDCSGHRVPAGVKYACACLCAVPTLVMLIILLCSIHQLGPQDQIVFKNPLGHWVLNGPYEGVVINFFGKESRQATLLERDEYAIVRNELDGELRTVNGPQLLFRGPYDHFVGAPKRSKIVLQQDEYARVVHTTHGTERVVRGPRTFVPEPLEVSPNGTQRCVFLETNLAALVLNRTTGLQQLVTDRGAFAPAPYEEILEVRHLIHVLPHEALVVRDAHGQLTVHAGSDGETARGMSFFLPPYSEVVQMRWSDHSELDDNPDDDGARPSVPVIKVDLRSLRIVFAYQVRTSDNVKLNLRGAIFWRIADVQRMVLATQDPTGDVWHHARSALIQAVSNATLAEFMNSFNSIVMYAFQCQERDGFNLGRGVVLESMEVTGFDCADTQTADTLQQIIQETTNRINQLTAQQSQNDVRAAALAANITLERQRTALITARAENDRLEAQVGGESMGLRVARSATAFLDGLNVSVPDAGIRVELYRMLEEQRSRNEYTRNLAQGNAKLFLTPQDLNLRLNVGSGVHDDDEF